MCGRFVSSSTPDKIAEYFGATFDGETLGENYNVAPTNDIYAVVAGPDGTPRLEVFHWGLIPVWAKERKIGAKMINARAETLAEKPAYKGVFKKNRCIIPMDGFYEWKAGEPGGPLTKAGKPAKQPMFIHRLDGEPLAVAGLWSAWRDKAAGPDADWLHSATVVTTVGQRDDGADPRPHAGDPAAVGVGDVARPENDDLETLSRPAASRRPTRCSTCTPCQYRRQQRAQQGCRADRAGHPSATLRRRSSTLTGRRTYQARPARTH